LGLTAIACDRLIKDHRMTNGLMVSYTVQNKSIVPNRNKPNRKHTTTKQCYLY